MLQQRCAGGARYSRGLEREPANGDPNSAPLYLDGSDTNTAQQLEGRIQETLGEFQKKELEDMIDALPEEVIDMAKKLPVEVRKQFVSAMSRGRSNRRCSTTRRRVSSITSCPGVIGLILQLLTVTLMACTIARERESGTLYQLMVTSLRRGEIVIGKILPYLAISIMLILVIIVRRGLAFSREVSSSYRARAHLPLCSCFAR